MKIHFFRAYYLRFDCSGRRFFIKSEILIARGMVWPVSSDKWKAPSVSSDVATFPDAVRLIRHPQHTLVNLIASTTLYFKRRHL